MIRRLLLLIVLVSFCGCASLTRPDGMFYGSSQEKKLTRAVTLLGRKQPAAAEELLTQICAGPGVPGVTDEAWFRLSLLHLGTGQDKNGLARARQDLERLKKEYPASSWSSLATILSAALAEIQVSADDYRHQIRRLKDLNLSLTRENKDLRQSIERLKSLELELGRGSKR